MAEFISSYNGINYKVPGSSKYAKFNDGKLVTEDSETISYLREHSDFGVTLNEIKHQGKSIAVDVDICGICGKVFKSERALSAHKLKCKEAGLAPEEEEEDARE